MSDTPTPRTDANCWEAIAGAMKCKPTIEHAYVPATFARELERELATENAINQRNCEDWAHDHTYLQNLCREAGFSEHDVEGDSYGIRSITQLGDMLRSKVAELERENARLQRVADLARDAVESGAIDECYLSLLRDALDLCHSRTPPNDKQSA